MKRFEFTLESVLKWRIQREKMAALEVSKAVANLENLRKRENDLRTELSQFSQTLWENDHPDLVGVFWIVRYEQSAYIGKEIDQTKKNIALALQHLAEVQRQYTEAALEVEKLKTIRKQQWEEFLKEFEKYQQSQLEEFASRKWIERNAQMEKKIR